MQTEEKNEGNVYIQLEQIPRYIIKVKTKQAAKLECGELKRD